MTADILANSDSNSVKIEQITEDNQLVKLWDSVEEIEEKLNYDVKCIINCCNGMIETYNSFIWKYTSTESTTSSTELTRSEWRCIGEVNSYIFSNYFISINNGIVRIINKKRKEISVRNGKVNLVDSKKRKHVFLVDTLATTMNILEEKPYKKYIKKIDKKTGKELKIYESIEEVCKDIENPISASITRVCNGEQKTAFGFRWSWCIIPTIGGVSSEKKCTNCGKGGVMYEDECDRCVLNKNYYTIYREFEKQQDPLEKMESNIKNHQRLCYYLDDNLCINEELRNIKSNALRSNVPFELPESICKDMMKIRCFYCGFLSDTEGIPNSITRKNNSKPYTVENIVPCCKLCSSSKNSIDSKEFITKMMHISKIFFDVGKEDPRVWSDNYSSSDGALATSDAPLVMNFQMYKDKAREQSLEWELTEETFDKICSLPCHYCLKSALNTNGVGRFINNIGYTRENCIACCSKCNTLRSDLTYGDFLNLAWSIAIHQTHKNALKS
jgi:hypothetical protein